MPRDTLVPLAKGCVKYAAILGGGKLLYDHSLALWPQLTGFCEERIAPQIHGDIGKFAIGVAAVGVAHFVLTKRVRARQSKEHFAEEALETTGQQQQEETPPASETPVKKGQGSRLLVALLTVFPKLAVAATGGQLLLTSVGPLGWLYGKAGTALLDLWAKQAVVEKILGSTAPSGVAHPVKFVIGGLLALLGYAIVRRGILRSHGPVHRLVYVDDRRIETLHWDTQKIRGFGLQLQTADTEGLIGDLTPTADAKTTVYNAEGKHAGTDGTVMYLPNLEPVKKKLDRLTEDDVRLVKDSIAETANGAAVSSANVDSLNVEKFVATVREKSEGKFTDVNMSRILMAMEVIGGEDVTQIADSAILEEANDVEEGFEGGMFCRSLYERDQGGHYVPRATMVEDMTLTDQLSSSPRNGYGPQYWRRGKVLIGFRFFRGAGEDSGPIRTFIHEIRKSRLRRYWDFGEAYRWTLREQNLRIDESWVLSYGWLIPFLPVTPRRYYLVRDSKGEVIARMREVFTQKLTGDMDWKIEIYADRLNSEEASYGLALLSEFLHQRRKYVRSRRTPGNTAHERLLVAGGKKRAESGESVSVGL